MRNDGKQSCDVSNAQFRNPASPPDVTDFATPVTSVEPRNNAGWRPPDQHQRRLRPMAYQTATST
jgi:hypothetical protein